MSPTSPAATGDGLRRDGRRRVAVTGLGAVCCLGSDVGSFWRALLERRSGIRPIARFDASRHRIPQGGEVAGLTLDPSREPVMQFLEAAADEALAHAGLADGRLDPGRAAVVLGTNFGAMDSTARALERIEGGGHAGPDLFASLRCSRPAEALSERIGFRGPVALVSLSCASGNAAIARAAEWIRCGAADVALAGGFDAISEVSWAGLGALRTMTTGPIRPFDRRRDGTVFSEGAGLLLLESFDHARRRGADVLAEVLGCWTNNNAFHMTHPDRAGEGLVRAMRGALDEAGLPPDAVDHVNAHGTATLYNDRIETLAIKTVLGERARRVPCNAIKSMLGHAMGAAAALEAICCVKTLREGVVPPTINLEEPDPECDLDYVSDGPREVRVRVVLNNSSGIGGTNSVVLLGGGPGA